MSAHALKDFYRDKVVLVTGGTGLVGRLAIEKVLLSGAAKVFVLIRPKRGKTPDQRVDAFFEERVYSRLADRRDLYRSRIHVLHGDLGELQLGLSAEELRAVEAETQIILHVAAHINFDDTFQNTLRVNLRGMRELLEIAERAKRLESMVFVSTAYIGCIDDEAKEDFYAVHVNPDLMIEALDRFDGQDEAWRMFAAKIAEPWPNAYCFSKVMAEELVRRASAKLPIAVVRPTVITATLDEPITGWCNNIHAMNGVLVGVATGVLRVLRIDERLRPDIVPADYVTNFILAAAWKTARLGAGVQSVYNCSASSSNRPNYTELIATAKKYGMEIPLLRSLWVISVTTTRSKLWASFLKIFYHLLPAFFFDLLLVLQQKKPRVLKLYRKVESFSAHLDRFFNCRTEFLNHRMLSLVDELSDEERRLFPCDPRTVDWEEFFKRALPGIRESICLESLDNIKAAKKRYRKLQVAHYFVLMLFYGVIALVVHALLRAVGITDWLVKSLK